ncbi:hypothetical protein [Planctopirus hydrillae]|nr:hypothetical protein [Planctopirus hydrillae]
MNSFLTQHQPPSAAQPSSTFRLDWLCWTALALTLILRVGWMVLKPESLAIDRDAYLLLAQNLVHGEGFCGPGGVPTAFRPPLFPLLLAPLLWLANVTWAVAILQLSLSLVLTWATIRTTQLLTIDRASGEDTRDGWHAAGGWAGMIVAIDPLLLLYSTQPMTEILAATLIMLLSLQLAQALIHPASLTLSRLMLAGLMAGCAPLARPALLLLLPWFLIGMGWIGSQHAPHRSPRLFLRIVMILAGFALIAPGIWMTRNQLVMGEPIVTTTHGGYTLWLANNPVIQELEEIKGTSIWPDEKFREWEARNREKLDGLSEVEQDKLQQGWAWQTIRRNPEAFTRSALLRMAFFWSPVPQSMFQNRVPWGLMELLFFSYGLFAMMACLGTIELLRSHRVFGVWLVGTVCLVMLPHVFYFSNARMRAPIEPLLAIPAAIYLVKLLQPLIRRTHIPED